MTASRIELKIIIINDDKVTDGYTDSIYVSENVINPVKRDTIMMAVEKLVFNMKRNMARGPIRLEFVGEPIVTEGITEIWR